VTKISVEHDFFQKEENNLPPQTLMSCNRLALAHYVGCITKLTLMNLHGGGLPNIMGRGLTIQLVLQTLSVIPTQ
jgi:hypothetical protein